MAPRDPSKTARNRVIKEMTVKLKELLPEVLEVTGFSSEASLNAKIGGKCAEFIDLHHEVILSPEHFAQLYIRGFSAALSSEDFDELNAHDDNYERLGRSEVSQEYFMLFLKRSYLRHMDELSRKRPNLDESAIWIGQNNAEFGLFVTPRFVRGEWQNDRSEIRKFPELYWTIGHVLRTGLVVPGDPDKIEFNDVNSYLTFFKNSLVRASGSKYEKAIAKRYIEFVKSAKVPERVPLLIPELRYAGPIAKHKYRLDFCIFDPFSMKKIGFELSPWSSHGYLSKLKGLSQKKINEMAKDNFEKEMSKHRSFFLKHGVYVLIYTDDQLANIDEVFIEMQTHLEPVEEVVQLDFALLDEFFS